MKHNAEQMVLFGSTSPMEAKIAATVKVTPRYVYKKEKGKDGKYHVVRDDNDQPVPLLNEQTGQKIMASKRIGLLPRKSEENADLTDLTGLSGQALMAFEREARDVLCDERLAQFQRLRASGQYTYSVAVDNLRTGALSLTIKPVFGGRNLVTSTDEEIRKEMERRGFTVEKAPAKDNGPAPKTTTPGEKKPKGGKGKAAQKVS